MSQLHPVSVLRHLERSWISPTDFHCFSNESVAPLLVSEMVRALWSIPMGFVRDGDRYKLVALLSLEANSNWLVDGRGRWIGRYLPKAYRSRPFILATAENGERVICVDESSGLVAATNTVRSSTKNWKRFYTDFKQPTEDFQKMKEFLSEFSSDLENTDRICRQLQALELIKPWPIKLVSGDTTVGDVPSPQDKPTVVNGIYSIDESALNELSGGELQEIRNTGALLACYVQLLSRNNIQALANLSQSTASNNQEFELFSEDGGNGGSLNFNNI